MIINEYKWNYQKSTVKNYEQKVWKFIFSFDCIY